MVIVETPLFHSDEDTTTGISDIWGKWTDLFEPETEASHILAVDYEFTTQVFRYRLRRR